MCIRDSWLLEELGVPYELKVYQRDKATRLAPPELKKIHPPVSYTHLTLPTSDLV